MTQLVMTRRSAGKCGRDDALEKFFQHRAELADRKTWSHLRAASRNLTKYAMAASRPYAKIYWVRLATAASLKEAAQSAGEMISKVTWTEENPRCCSRYCCNNRNAMTGIWTPLHVSALPDQNDSQREKKEATRRMLENVWWRNKLAARDHYIIATPQKKVAAVIDDPFLRHRVTRKIRHFYVVCSEYCFSDANHALSTIYWRDPTQFLLLLGVEQVPDLNISD